MLMSMEALCYGCKKINLYLQSISIMVHINVSILA